MSGVLTNPSRASLYQKYLEWCEGNGEKPLASKVAGKKFSEIGIESKQTRTGGGKREWQYILDRSKIVAMIREKVGDIEEFSDIPQPKAPKADELPTNESTEIPVFNIPEITPSKMAPPQPEKKVDKWDNTTQNLFDHMRDEEPVTSTSGTSETSKPLEPVINKPEVSKPSKSIKPSSNEVSSAILLSRTQREQRLRKWAIDHGEDPDVFVTITEKDIRLSHEYRDRMMSDADAVDFAKEDGMDVNDIFYMSRRERLISEEIYLRNQEDVGKPRAYVYDNEEWRKGINILQENGHLW
ncbi:hypothetical protein RhiirA4_483257 [Rhizophagus irregularis]|uniref:DNA primase/nucleoside triphosphatase C-terminal domain-containing protein n=1 Tax=Rhizophagus irregularis TaxID=588596 RepID=A0A2I1HMB4_9GLOM|nr:hypothetical protein RhiirA4_483257 [Rhizophagus irregularis]